MEHSVCTVRIVSCIRIRMYTCLVVRECNQLDTLIFVYHQPNFCLNAWTGTSQSGKLTGYPNVLLILFLFRGSYCPIGFQPCIHIRSRLCFMYAYVTTTFTPMLQTAHSNLKLCWEETSGLLSLTVLIGVGTGGAGGSPLIFYPQDFINIHACSVDHRDRRVYYNRPPQNGIAS